jgi:putative membrane protein
MINWQQPQRQSLAALAIMGIHFFKQVFGALWPMLIVPFLNNNEKKLSTVLLAIAFIILVAIVFAVLGYLNFKFYINDNKFIILSGVFKKKVITIPLEKIQSIHLEQSLLHSVTGTFKVLIDTAGTEKIESSIYALNTHVAASLKDWVLSNRGSQAIEYETVQSPKIIIQTTTNDLVKLCLTANHLETLLLVCVFIFSKLEDMKPLLNKMSFGWLEKYEQEIEITWMLAVTVIVLIAVLSIVLSSIRTILRYANFKVEVSAKGFHIKGGLIKMKQVIIPFKKVQLINWNANFLKRFTGMYVLHLKATGESDLNKKQKVLLPITQQNQLDAIIPFYEDEIPANNTQVNGIHQVFVWRRIFMIGLPVTIVITSIGCFLFSYSGLWVMTWFIYFTITTALYKKNFQFWINTNALQVLKGVWGRQHTLMKWNNVQFVTLKQSPYQRKKQLANVIFYTAGGKVILPYLTLTDATLLVDYVAMKIESSNTSWM